MVPHIQGHFTDVPLNPLEERVLNWPNRLFFGKDRVLHRLTDAKL